MHEGETDDGAGKPVDVEARRHDQRQQQRGEEDHGDDRHAAPELDEHHRADQPDHAAGAGRPPSASTMPSGTAIRAGVDRAGRRSASARPIRASRPAPRPSAASRQAATGRRAAAARRPSGDRDARACDAAGRRRDEPDRRARTNGRRRRRRPASARPGRIQAVHELPEPGPHEHPAGAGPRAILPRRAPCQRRVEQQPMPPAAPRCATRYRDRGA